MSHSGSEHHSKSTHLSTDEQLDKLLHGLEAARSQGPSDSVRRAIEQQCSADLTPAVGWTTRQRLLTCLAGAALAISGTAAVLHGDGVHTVRRSALYGVVGWSLVMLLVLVVSFGRRVALATPARIGVVLAVPTLFYCYLVACGNSWVPLAQFARTPSLALGSLHCGAMAMALGALSAGASLYVWRRSDPFSPGLSGALAGLFGGLTGALSMHLVCPSSDGWHLLLGHGLATLTLIVLGGYLGRRVLAP